MAEGAESTKSSKPKVCVTRRLPDKTEARMAELFACRFNVDDHLFSREELKNAVQECNVLVPAVTDRVDKDIIDSAGAQLKLVASYGAGVDHIDIAAAKAKKLVVTNTPDVLTEDTADMNMALILSVARRMCEGERRVREGKWHGWAPTAMLGQRIAGKKLGIIGLGRTGRALARRALGFGLSVHYHKRRRLTPQAEREYKAQWWESLDQMLAHMDVVSVNCPHTPASYHLLSERRLRLMRKEAILVNTSRGEVVEERALIAALAEKRLAGAGLDVFENGPVIHPRLLQMENVVLLPHMCSATHEARMEMGEKIIVNIRSWADGHMPPDRVVDTVF